MPVMNCPACGGTVSAQAPTCPHCGHPLRATPTSEAGGCGYVLLIVVGVLIAGAMVTSRAGWLWVLGGVGLIALIKASLDRTEGPEDDE